MVWQQGYLLFGHGIAFSFLVVLLPILTLLVLLGVFRRPAWQASLFGLAVTFAVALAGYHMPMRIALSAAAYGAAFGLFPISWIVFWAIALFRVTTEAGKFEIIKNSIGQLTQDPRLQALLIAFAFGGFLEGAAGFGTPVAIASTMLVGLGFDPFRASALCLLSNTAPVAFGSIGIPIITLAGTTGLPLRKLSAAVGALCTPLAIVVPVYLMYATGGMGTMAGIWTPVLVGGLVFGLMQLVVATYVGPQLTDILAAGATLLALVLVLQRRRERIPPAVARAFCSSEAGMSNLQILPRYTPGTVAGAWMPYGLLVVCMLLWGWTSFQAVLNKTSVVFRWPGLHDRVARMPPLVGHPTPYHAFFTLNWLGAAGTACMVTTLLSAMLLRLSLRQFLGTLLATAKQLRLPTLTVMSVLALAFLMNYSGATATLGLAFAATGALFPLFSTLLGWMGVFLTGSDTSANALFGSLQVVTAESLHLNPVLLAAANSAGGVMGKMISLQTLAITAAATGLDAGQQVKLFRFTLRHSIVLVLFTGMLALLYAYVFPIG